MRAAGTGREGADGGRKRWLLWGILVYLAILAVVGGSLYLLGRASRERLDEALGERLAAVARTAAYLVDGDSLAVWAIDPRESLEFIWLSSRLEQIRLENELAEITLCDTDEQVLVSAAGRLRRGEKNLFWDLDRESVQIARGGFLAVSRLYRVDALYQKSAHAPIFALDGRVTGVLTVEGNADFFDSLQALRNWAVLTGAAVLVFLSLMGWLLYRLQTGMERYRASVMRQENLATMGRMTAGIAHEIRNPLGIISGAAQHLRRRLNEVGIEDEMAGFIPDEVARLDRILKGYLAFGSDTAAELESVDLELTVRRTVRLLADDFATTGHELVVSVDGDLGPVQSDPRRLQQVLLNLLLNAREAMADPGPIQVDLRKEGGEVVLTITDEGAGLQGLSDEKLFAPFWTSKEKGSGLGLSVARRILAEQGGRLQLDDRPDGRGAVAEIRLPLQPTGAAGSADDSA